MVILGLSHQHLKLPTVGYTPAKTRRMSRSLSNLHAANYLREGGGEGNREGSLSDEITTLSDIKRLVNPSHAIDRAFFEGEGIIHFFEILHPFALS